MDGQPGDQLISAVSDVARKGQGANRPTAQSFKISNENR